MHLDGGIGIGCHQQTTITVNLHERGLPREFVYPAPLIAHPHTGHVVMQEHTMRTDAANAIYRPQTSRSPTVHQSISTTDTDTAHVPDGGARGIGRTMLKAVDGFEAGQGEHMNAALTDDACTLSVGCQQQILDSGPAACRKTRDESTILNPK